MAYTGETAYITGGASGIGRALAARLVSKGMKVVIGDRNIEGAKEVAREANQNGEVAWAVQVDVSDWESQRKAFEEAIDKLGRINYVFGVAGIPESSWLPNKPKSTVFEKPNLSVWDVNGTGPLYTSALAIQHFRRLQPGQNGYRGKIVIVASGCSFYYIPPLPIYTASKHAVLGFVRSFGKYLPDEKITLNAVCPNIVKTNISTGEFYDRAEKRGLLCETETVLGAFESLLGTTETSGEAVEILPGDEGYRIKEKLDYTTVKVRESVEMTHDRSHRSFKFHQPILD